MALTIATWNLQGSHGVDTGAAADRLRALAGDRDLDLVALQEVQRHQARALATALGMRVRWVFKHWPVRTWPEGLAVLTRHPLAGTRRVPLQGAPFWSWRRRVALLTLVTTPDGQVGLADVHFSPHDEPGLRRAESARLVVSLERFGIGAGALLAGDFNDDAGNAAHEALVGAGWHDAWPAATRRRGAGATCWHGGRTTGAAPQRRIDYVLVPPGWTVQEAAVPDPGPDGWPAWAALSDHVPLAVTVSRSR